VQAIRKEVTINIMLPKFINIEPRNDQVLLESFPDEVRNTRVNLEPRIILPDSQKEPSRFSKVLAIGPVVAQNGDVKVGDIVFTSRYPKSCQNVDGKLLVIVREEEILCRVT
jgi:co-chaperonin GroES (HSP10)